MHTSVSAHSFYMHTSTGVLVPRTYCTYLWCQQWQPDLRQQTRQRRHPDVTVVVHPQNERMKDELLIGHVEIVTAQNALELFRRKQQEFLIADDVDKPLLKIVVITLAIDVKETLSISRF